MKDKKQTIKAAYDRAFGKGRTCERKMWRIKIRNAKIALKDVLKELA